MCLGDDMKPERPDEVITPTEVPGAYNVHSPGGVFLGTRLNVGEHWRGMGWLPGLGVAPPDEDVDGTRASNLPPEHSSECRALQPDNWANEILKDAVATWTTPSITTPEVRDDDD